MFARYLYLLLVFATSAYATPQIQHWQTTKGARVYFVEAHELPIVDIQMSFDAGSARDPLHKKGLASITNSLLADGAADLNADQISYEFERLGAVYGANAGYDSASITLRSLADKNRLDPAVTNLRKVISEPVFPVAALERERKRFLVGIQQKKQSPAAVARDAFYAAVYGKHPYAYPQEGTVETIAAITRADIITFHRQYYVARNAIIAIVGDLDKAQAEMLAEELTQSMQRGDRAPALSVVPAAGKARLIKHNHPSTQTHILLGEPGMKRGDADYFPLYVGNHILGGSGLVSLLAREIREKRGLSYSVYSYFSPMRVKGPFLVGLSTRAAQASRALQVLRDNIRAFINNGPDETELVAAKKNITGGFPLRLDSNSNILAYIAMIGFYGLPLDYLDTFNAKVRAVTVADIRDAFARRIAVDNMVTVIVGPDNAADEESN